MVLLTKVLNPVADRHGDRAGDGKPVAVRAQEGAGRLAALPRRAPPRDRARRCSPGLRSRGRSACRRPAVRRSPRRAREPRARRLPRPASGSQAPPRPGRETASAARQRRGPPARRRGRPRSTRARYQPGSTPGAALRRLRRRRHARCRARGRAARRGSRRSCWCAPACRGPSQRPRERRAPFEEAPRRQPAEPGVRGPGEQREPGGDLVGEDACDVAGRRGEMDHADRATAPRRAGREARSGSRRRAAGRRSC